MGNSPLSNIIRDGGMMNIFRSVGCVGDSLSSGEFEYDAGGEKGFWDCYEYSWGKQIERITGIEMTNFSRGGLTAYQLYKEADEKTSPIEDINRLFEADNAKQGYIVALGVNDIKGKDNLKNLYGGKIGNAEDIDLDDYNNNAHTFVGAYAKIIQRLKMIQPRAKFFLVTMPSDNGSEEFNAAIESIAQKLRYILPSMRLLHNLSLYRKKVRGTRGNLHSKRRARRGTFHRLTQMPGQR